MPEKVSITKTKLDNLANAISAKSGEPLNLTIDEMEAAVNGINIGEENTLEGVKVNGVELPIDNQKKVNIPVVSENKVGVMTPSLMNDIYDNIDNKADKSEIPTTTSQLTNDSNFAVDSNYIHTDNNFTTILKDKLDGVASGAEVNVQSDWNVTDTSSDAFIKNKPSIPASTSDLVNDSNFVSDANYVHTDNNLTNALTTKLNGIAEGAEVNVQSDWNISDSSSDAFIKNKPSIPTRVSDLTNDSNYQTDTEVETAITEALADIVGFSVEIVNSLPATGDAGIFYFVPNSVEQNNIYDEYLYVNNAWEKLGTTEIDLSNYLQKTDIAAWAKAPNKPTYTAQEVGALPDTTVIPTKTSDLTNDSGFITTSIYSGTCASAAEATTKVVTCADFTDLEEGSAILVNFNVTNTAAVADLMLNVNNTGAKKIQYINNGTRGNLSSAGYLKASTTYLFVYDGTYWVAYFNYNTTYSSMTDAEITAGTGTTARTITPARLKTAVGTWAPVTSVNNQTGDVSLSIPDSTSDLTNDSGFITSASLPTKVSDLTNDSGYITNSEEDDPVFTASAAYGIQSSDITNWNNKSDFSGNYNDLTNKPTIPTVPTNVSAFTNDAGYLTSYTETDPVFSASPAAGITSSDITSWNNKVSDDKTWNGVTLSSTTINASTKYYVPIKAQASSGSGTANWIGANETPTAHEIARYDASSYLKSTTPPANDNSTKVATTAYVDAATPIIPTNISSFTNDSGYLTLADLPIYDGAVI